MRECTSGKLDWAILQARCATFAAARAPDRRAWTLEFVTPASSDAAVESNFLATMQEIDSSNMAAGECTCKL
jgi:hypothetical protein